MTTETQVAAAMYREKPAMQFEDIVDEFELSLRAGHTGRRSVTFDYDDLVIIELEQVRVGLAWIAPEAPNQPYGLVLATGPGPANTAPEASRPLLAQLNEKLLARLNREIPYDTVVRANLPEELSVDLLDKVAVGLQSIAEAAAPGENTPEADADVLDDIATPASPAAHRESIAPEIAAAQNAAASGPAPSAAADNGFSNLRQSYQNALREDRAQTSVIWQALMAGANTMTETLTQGADLVRQATGPEQRNPYERLKTRRLTRQLTRPVTRSVNPDAPRKDTSQKDETPDRNTGGPFAPDEYELYGSLLD